MNILFLFLVFLPPVFFGTTLLSSFRLFKEKFIILLIGSIVGLAVYITTTFLLVPLLPLIPLTVAFMPALLLAASFYFIKTTPAKNHWCLCRLGTKPLIAFIILFATLFPVSAKLLIEKDSALHTGIVNAWADIGWHVSNITSLQENKSLQPTDPIFPESRLAYPFLCNFFSAMLIATGTTLDQAVSVPAIMLIPLALTLFFILVFKLTSSKTAAIIAVLLLIFNGSVLGWFQLIDDTNASNQPPYSFLTHFYRNYSGDSNNDEGLVMGNPISALLLPQRSFVFGLPIALSIILLLIEARKENSRAYYPAGLLYGLLPLFHAHTALALLPLLAAFYVVNPEKPWYRFIFPAVLVGLPEIFLYRASSLEPGSFLNWQPGWVTHQSGWFSFWLKNTGLLLPVTLLALALPAKKELKLLAVSGLILFLTANLFIFAVWAWDNTKIFFYWTLFTLPLISHTAARYLHSSSATIKGIALALIIAHSISGFLDISHLILSPASWQIWDKDGVAIAKKINNVSEPDDIILTAPTFNSPVALSGRYHYLGYTAHVWTHGGDPAPRENASRSFYKGDSANLPGTMPSYVLVGPHERQAFPDLKIRPEWVPVASENEYSLFSLTNQTVSKNQ